MAEAQGYLAQQGGGGAGGRKPKRPTAGVSELFFWPEKKSPFDFDTWGLLPPG